MATLSCYLACLVGLLTDPAALKRNQSVHTSTSLNNGHHHNELLTWRDDAELKLPVLLLLLAVLDHAILQRNDALHVLLEEVLELVRRKCVGACDTSEISR